jgi:altronate hydrolase
MKQLLQINPRDNVAVALSPLTCGDTVEAGGITLTLRTDVPAGHKVALADIPAGSQVIKYGCPIGAAREDIPAGSHVHVHNLRTLLSGELSYRYAPVHATLDHLPVREFPGYPRKDGRVGVRN